MITSAKNYTKKKKKWTDRTLRQMVKAKLHRQNHTKKHTHTHSQKRKRRGFPGGAVVENLPANAGETGSSPGLGRSHMPRSD